MWQTETSKIQKLKLFDGLLDGKSLFFSLAVTAETLKRTSKIDLTDIIYEKIIKKGSLEINNLTCRIIDKFSIQALIEAFWEMPYGEDIKDKKTVINLGSNIGAFPLYIASKNPKSKIYAYELVPYVAEILLKNIRLNKLEKIIKGFNCGIGWNNGIIKIKKDASVGASIFSNNPKSNIKCRIKPFENIFIENNLKNVDLLIMDVEGAEYGILFNLPTKYLQMIKEIRMEFHQCPYKKEIYNIEQLAKYLEKNCFKVIKIDNFNKSHGRVNFIRKN